MQKSILKDIVVFIVLICNSLNCISMTLSDDKYTRTPSNSKEFKKLERYSDEFNSTVIDRYKWINPLDNGFATWTFIPENVKQEEGKLKLTMNYEKHNRSKDRTKQTLYFNSGLLRSTSKVGYGYYEVRMKGASVWPGTCSAFWLYTLPQEEKINSKNNVNEIIYNEIDAVEIQQVPKDKNIISCNMHIWVLNDELKTDRIMAGKYPGLGKNEFKIEEFDAEEHFHIYAVENRPDSVVFYIDNKRVASKPNYFWHKKMYLTLSLGLRTPYEKYINNQRLPLPVTEDDAEKGGFPCVMEIDYIRSWERDYSKFKSSQIKYDERFIKQFEKSKY